MSKFKLPIGFKDRWIAALESGNYKKTTGKLFRSEADQPNHSGYCCLGVAAHICGIPNEKLIEEGYIRRDIVATDTKAYKLNELAKEAGFPESLVYNGDLKCVADDLASLNDTGKTFAEVIEYIKQNAIEDEREELQIQHS